MTDSLPEITNLGYVHLTVGHLERQIAFYKEVLNMRLHWKEGNSAGLGAGGSDLLRLTEVPGAKRVKRTTGLYHFALEYPSRKELARALARLRELGYPHSPTDHTLSESIYLDDPEGQTIELYILTLHRGKMSVVAGNPVFVRTDGRPATGRDPLDVADLLRARDPVEPLDGPLPSGTTLGHINLFTANLDDEVRFFHTVLGFQRGPVSTNSRMAEVGLSDTRPHIIPFNTWQGENAPPPPENALGLRFFTIVLPDAKSLSEAIQRVKENRIPTLDTPEGVLVRDPAQNGMVLTLSR